MRLSYRQWYNKVSALAAALSETGLKRGDHVLTAMQNRWENASLHWACQFLGLIRHAAQTGGQRQTKSTSASRIPARRPCSTTCRRKRPCACRAARSTCRKFSAEALASIMDSRASDAVPLAGAADWSLMLYNVRHDVEAEGCSAPPPGRTRRRRRPCRPEPLPAWRAYTRRHAALSQRWACAPPDRILAGSAALFVCLPRFDAAKALDLIEQEKITHLYLVPTLYHDLVHHEAFSPGRVASVSKLGYAGASMTDGLLKRLDQIFRPELFVNHYGSSEIYTFTIEADGGRETRLSAGRAGINQTIRVVKLGSRNPDERAAVGEEGEIIALMKSDEAFEGYWNRPDADAKALHGGWYFTGDTGFRRSGRRSLRPPAAPTT